MASALLGSPKQNQILAALAPAELARLEPSLELVPLPANQVLWEAGTAAVLTHPTKPEMPEL
jgi:hypothetical protein